MALPQLKLTKIVWCTFELEGMHHWRDAPSEYEYLAAAHRHMFHVRVDMRVTNSNREVEFIELKHFALEAFMSRRITNELYFGMWDFGCQSCEMLAEGTANYLTEKFGIDVVSVTVSEDGENGATVKYEI